MQRQRSVAPARSRTLRALLGAAAIVAALAAAPLAGAHVQVLPALAATDDPTMYTVLVPNERDTATVQVELGVPPEIIPFSFEAAAGWTRSEKLNPDGSLESVIWKGELPPGEFARFTFLAGTPSEAATLRWPAVQTYADGTEVAWIGDPDSDEPAAVTRVSPDAPRQNAGGEGAPADEGGGGATPEPATDAETSSATATTDAADPSEAATTLPDATATEAAAATTTAASDDTARALGIVGIVCGLIGLALGAAAYLRGRSRRPSRGSDDAW